MDFAHPGWREESVTRWTSLGLSAAGVLLGGCWEINAARAQELPRAVVSASYMAVVDAALAEGGMRRESGAHGWSADVGMRITRLISLVGSVDGSYGEEEEAVSPLVFGGGTQRSSWTDMAYLGGVRFHFGLERRVVPFLQTLAGLMSTHQTFEYQTVRPGGPFENDERFGVLVPGGGVDIALTRRLGVRLGVDVPIHLQGMIEGGDDTTMTRLVAGVVMRFP